MPITDNKKASNARYMAKLDNIMVRPDKAEGAKIRQAAADAGESVQHYILCAIRARMDKPQKKMQK